MFSQAGVNQKVGTALVRAAEAVAGPAGELSIGVGTDNVDALRLYARLGYVSTGCTKTTTYTYVDDDNQAHSLRGRRDSTEDLVTSSPARGGVSPSGSKAEFRKPKADWQMKCRGGSVKLRPCVAKHPRPSLD